MHRLDSLFIKIQSSNFFWGVATLSLALGVHFWYIFLHFTQVLYGGPGDHTAGLIWLYQHYPSSPWWVSTQQSAYPFGEHLWNSTFILGQAYYVTYWVLSSIWGNGIAGYNAFMLFGVVASFLASYIFFRRFGAKDFIAAIFSYCVVFNPFILGLIAVGHISYIFAPLYSAAVVFYLSRIFIKGHYRFREILSLALLVGGTWLLDPYYILFIGLLAGGFLGGVYFANCLVARRLIFRKESFRSLMLLGTLTVIGFLPLLIFAGFNKQSLQKNTYDVRSDIHLDAVLYSMRAKDYLLPSAYNPLVPTSIKNYKTHTYHGGNPTFTTYLGWSTILLATLTICYVVKLRLNNKLIHYEQESAIAYGLLGSIVLLLAFSLQPILFPGSLNIPTPTYLLISIVGIWRVVARSYIFVLFLSMLLLALSIAIVSRNLGPKKGKYIIAIMALTLLMPLDFLARNPFDAAAYFKIDRDLPSTYKLIKDKKDIRIIAEYPLREAPHYRGSLYFTYQLYHKKTLFNSIATVTDETLVRESLMDLNNPQTIRSLRLLGVDSINVWNNWVQQWSPADKEHVQLLGDSKYRSMFGPDDVKLYSLKNLPIYNSARYIVSPSWDARMTNGEYLSEVKQNMQSKGSLRILDLCNLKGIHSCPVSETKDFKTTVIFVNQSDKNRLLKIKVKGITKDYLLSPSSEQQVTISNSMSISDTVEMDLNETSGMFIYDYHAEPVEEI